MLKSLSTHSYELQFSLYIYSIREWKKSIIYKDMDNATLDNIMEDIVDVNYELAINKLALERAFSRKCWKLF